MVVGHYSVSFAAKKLDGSIPLWVLFVAVQLLDLVWAQLVLLGIEKVHIVPGFTASNPLDLYYMPFSHSLVAAVLWSACAFAIYRLAVPHSTRRSSLVLAGSVFSHWLLDLVVHEPDLPLIDNVAKVGLGLWNYPTLEFGLEAAVLFVGVWLYLSSGMARPTRTVAFAIVILAVQAYITFGSPVVSDKAAAATTLATYAVIAVVSRLLERRTSTVAGAV